MSKISEESEWDGEPPPPRPCGPFIPHRPKPYSKVQKVEGETELERIIRLKKICGYGD